MGAYKWVSACKLSLTFLTKRYFIPSAAKWHSLALLKGAAQTSSLLETNSIPDVRVSNTCSTILQLLLSLYKPGFNMDVTIDFQHCLAKQEGWWVGNQSAGQIEGCNKHMNVRWLKWVAHCLSEFTEHTQPCASSHCTHLLALLVLFISHCRAQDKGGGGGSFDVLWGRNNWNICFWSLETFKLRMSFSFSCGLKAGKFKTGGLYEHCHVSEENFHHQKWGVRSRSILVNKKKPVCVPYTGTSSCLCLRVLPQQRTDEIWLFPLIRKAIKPCSLPVWYNECAASRDYFQRPVQLSAAQIQEGICKGWFQPGEAYLSKGHCKGSGDWAAPLE